MFRHTLPLASLLFDLAWIPSFLFGQAGTGEIIGTVRDATNAAVPNVKVTLTHQSSMLSRELMTENNGMYVATALPVGEYSIKAELANFKTQVREGITLQVGRRDRKDFVLELGDRAEVVIVVESTDLLRSTNAEVGEVISNQRILNLPLNGRQFVDLALLIGSVFKAPRGTRGSALAQTGTAVVVAGQRAGHNMYYLDGVSVTDQYFNHLVASPPVDTIEEFNIQKSIYQAEFGGKASATISAVIKSGSNVVHGSLYEFVRHDALDARNFFDPGIKPPFRQNQFGGMLGGPIHRDRTFFLLGYERLRVRQAQTQTFTVPTSAVRAGDFSGLPAIYDPRTTDVTGRRTAFPDNRVPTGRLDPVAVAFLQKLPLPNAAGDVQNLVASPAVRNDSTQGVVRIDRHSTAKDTFFGRLYIADFDTFQPLGSSLLNESLVPGFGYHLTTRTTSLGLGETHVLHPNDRQRRPLRFLAGFGRAAERKPRGQFRGPDSNRGNRSHSGPDRISFCQLCRCLQRGGRRRQFVHPPG